jgi:hypothetical protein
MAHYSFTTLWRLEAPVTAIWPAIIAVEHWPQWWRGVEAVALLRPGDPLGAGAIYRYTWKSKLSYRLIFDMETTRVDLHRRLEGVATGDLQGSGCWSFNEAGGVTTVRYDWNVRTTRAWMNLLAPLARPFFVRNHHVVMAWGGEGLAKLLGARLASANKLAPRSLSSE